MSEPDLSALRREPSIPPPASRWKSRVLLPAAVLAVFAAVFAVAARDSLFPGTPVRVVPVVVKAAAGGDLGGSVTSQAAGWVEADPFPIYVAALADGVVREVLVLEGEAVQAGQVVARLVPDDARIALDRAEAALRDAVAARETAEKDLETLVERRRADAVASATLAESKALLETNAADIAASEARVKAKETVVRSDESLVKAGALQELTLVQERYELDALRAETEALRAGRRVAEARVLQAGADRDAAAESLRLLLPERLAVARAKAAEDGARAARDEAALRLSRMEVRATAAGVVQKRLAAPGSKVMAVMDDPHSTHVVHLYDPAHLQVRVDVPLAEASRVGVGHRARVVVEILPDRVFRGEVTRIVNEADVQKNTLQVKVRILDPVPELKPEMLARAQFLSPAPAAGSSERGAERVFAPSRLLRPAGTGKATVLVAERGVAVSREVVLGAGREEGWVEVSSGLSPGDRLVDAAPGEIREGQRIRVTAEGR
jgi:multidrug efflux pump subunit AcrA (membrane-fusion protein)